uniref:Uncharacterized protein n=1 Tax=Anguilla anguilla TaxID=7936 RepID=A0A0E9SG38_ANGAN
MYSPSVEQTLA